MLFSLSWLQEYVDLPDDVPALAHRLTMAGLPVEGIETSEIPDSVVLARIVEAQKHPNADRLTLCKVDAGGDELLQIVCGAPNAREGLVSALATVGTVMPAGFKIKKSKIRGEVSMGMLCSPTELGLGQDHSGILDLPDGKLGTPLKEILGPGDTVIDLDITANRGDVMSHLGLARELGALFDKKVGVPKVDLQESGSPASTLVKVSIEDYQDCPLYQGRVIRGVKIGESPDWLKKKLEAIGQRPISNIVDITNFILLESGQPLHAFDLNTLKGDIRVRRAQAGEELTTLDGGKHKLSPEVLLIVDGDTPVAAAGVMGGGATEVTDQTVDIFLEAAVFTSGRVLKGSRELKLDTEAAIRFRRGVNPHGTRWALDRAARLMAEVAGGQVLPGVIEDAAPGILEPKVIALRPDRVNQLLGESLPLGEIKTRLSAWQCKVEADSEPWLVTVPGWRSDLSEECDLIEEVARHMGYDRIGVTQSNVSAVNAPVQPEEILRRRVSECLRGFGYHEALTRALGDPALLHTLGFAEAQTQDRIVGIPEAPSLEESSLRLSPLPMMLQSLSHNVRHGQPEARLFELAKTFEAGGTMPKETEWVVLGAVGGEFSPSRERSQRSYSKLEFKGVVEELLSAFGIDDTSWQPYTRQSDTVFPEGAVEIRTAEDGIGFLWEPETDVLEYVDLKRPAFLAQVKLESLGVSYNSADQVRFAPMSKFPSVKRDLALVVGELIQQAEVRNSITQSGGKFLESLELFDTYKGEHIPDGHVGLGYSIVFRAPDRTLEETEVDTIMAKLTEALGNQGIQIRDA